MDLLPTPEQDEIITSVRSMIDNHHTLGEPLEDALWNAAVEQGWFGLGLEEHLGGVGYSLAEEVLLFRELGRACVPGPFLQTVLAARIAAEAGVGDLAAAIVGGEHRVGLAETYDESRFAVRDAGGATLLLVVDGARAALHRPVADSAELASFDTLVPLALIGRASVGEALAVAPDPAGLHLRASLLIAAMLAGMAQATTDQSVGYAKDREQFGQPVGGFQAVKHRCADMAIQSEVANCQVLYAALALRDGLDDGPFHAHAARVVAARAAIANSQVNVQNHGGIGFTWEHTAHRYVTRSRVLASALGTATSELAALLAEPTPA